MSVGHIDDLVGDLGLDEEIYASEGFSNAEDALRVLVCMSLGVCLLHLKVRTCVRLACSILTSNMVTSLIK